MRKFQILHDRNHIEDEIEDRESLQRSRNYAFNSFDNITKQQFIENRKVDFSRFDPKKDEVYPPYPDNQILFLFDFSDMDVLNDVLEIVLYHCAKKNTL